MSVSSLRGLRRTHGYPAFYSAATLTRLADEMFGVGAVLLVLDRTGSASLAGLTVAAATLPSLLTGPLLGAWLDLRGKRRMLMVADSAIATAVLIAIALAAGNVPGWLLPLMVIPLGLTWPLSFGGFTSLIPVIVPGRLLPQANALEATSFNVALITGPALAGTICGFADPAASLYVEAVLTAAGLVLILLVPNMDRAEPYEAGRSFFGVVRNGLAKLVAVPALRGVTLTGSLGLGGIGMLSVAFPFFCVEALGGERSDAGYLWAAFAGGSALGAMALVRLQVIRPPHQVMFGAVGLFGCMMFLWPLSTSIPMAMALMALAGFVDGPGLAATFAVRQQHTPPELHGQIFTTAVSFKVGSFALGAALGGPALHAFGAEGTIVVAASAQLVAVAAGWLAMRAPLGARGAQPVSPEAAP